MSRNLRRVSFISMARYLSLGSAQLRLKRLCCRSLIHSVPSGSRAHRPALPDSHSRSFPKPIERVESLRPTTLCFRMPLGGIRFDVISPPPDKLFSETNDNSIGILLTFGAARVLLASDAERKAKKYMSNGPYVGSLTVIKV